MTAIDKIKSDLRAEGFAEKDLEKSIHVIFAYCAKIKREGKDVFPADTVMKRIANKYHKQLNEEIP